MPKKLIGFLTEFIIVSTIIGFGWFLIGFYLAGNYLETGYQDWMYHAFRIEEMVKYGIPSWNHVWVNGLNIFRGYHFIAHLPAVLLVMVTGISVQKAMLIICVSMFLLTRLVTYWFLRANKVSRTVALFAVALSYTHPQHLGAMKDYASYVAGYLSVLISIFIYFATKKNDRFIFSFFAWASLSWGFHPVVGVFLGILAAIRLFSSKYRNNFKAIVFAWLLYLPGLLAYVIPVMHQGIRYESPGLSTVQFFKIGITGSYFGLGQPLMYALMGSIILILIFGNRINYIWKVLVYFLVIFFILVYITSLGYLPEFFLQFQFGRALVYSGILIPIAFAGIVQSIFAKKAPFFASTIMVVFLGYFVVNASDISSSMTGQPVLNVRLSETTDYIQNLKPTGSVYLDDVSKASYLSKGDIRFITSYNEHLLPSPLSLRLKFLLKDDATYSSLSKKNLDLLTDYATVFGIEYIFLRPESPLEVTLKYDVYENQQLRVVDHVGDYTVIQNTEPIAYAYLIEKSEESKWISTKTLEKPTLSVTSYEPWDEDISKLAQAIRLEKLRPLYLRFVQPDMATIFLDKEVISEMSEPELFTTLSYDPNWSVQNSSEAKISGTSTRFMLMDLPLSGVSRLELKNSWPWWHWPLQLWPYLSFVIVLMWVWFKRWRERNKKLIKEFDFHVPYNLIFMNEAAK